MADPLRDAIERVKSTPLLAVAGGVVLAGVALYLHFVARRWGRNAVLRDVNQEHSEEEAERLGRAFRRNTRFWRSIFEPDPVGWTARHRKLLKGLVSNTNRLVQTLNDRFTDPSGKRPAQIAEERRAPEPEQPRIVSGDVIPREESV